ncbi:MAG: tRNA (guanine(46)-N(7))-methyltransferase TrmB [Oceanibaculum nanhaiense]|uniref:tRNA (guanine(46)-N(7))-methyltransferase TrmB n=1 Tax=Oceanibaculum nanhaiense TaxID=1909734 RepID=UPI0025A3E518|nr:tRNA (guanine(46)-N(7))-methyltransferase TrmB [Oceanibaculum nanhaiense]MDM7945728.1 tRNA (guanine(46)-N(7))-methyltransferase TrmB [Oceanibaculum nanhaiense]
MVSDEDGHARKFYGRRRGRRLRPWREQLFDEALPRYGLSFPEGWADDESPLDPAALFGEPVDALWIEVGFGGGEHLAAQAKAHAQARFIGFEPFVNGVASLLRYLEEDHLGNVRVHADDARPVLERLPDASVDRFFLLFPDPWPKKRHHFRRFIQPETMALLARLLKDGAELRIASDDMGVARWMLAHVTEHPAFEWLARRPGDWREPPADWVQTRYEGKALAQGRQPVYLRFRRRPRGQDVG